MTPANHERWRVHGQHCPSKGTDSPCWGPDACQRCIEIGNTISARATSVQREVSDDPAA